MRIVFIGTVKFSEAALKKLLKLRANVVGIVTKRSSVFNADFQDLSKVARLKHIPYKYTENINSSDTIKWIRRCTPDIIFCFGWSELLSKEILNVAPMGVLGFHPTKLPKNRGRHPIIWALALGLKKTASTFFFMDGGADSGDILSQVDIDIDYKDNARSLYNKVIKTALRQIEDFLPRLKEKRYVRRSQLNKRASYWRKREYEDGLVDFRMSSRSIYNLIRALDKPYLGASVLYKGKNIRIWKAKETDKSSSGIEPGKVLSTKGRNLLVSCNDRAILLTKHEFKKLPNKGEYIK